MGVDVTMKVKNLTADTNATLTGVIHLHGAICRNSGTGASTVDFHDALTVTGTPVLSLAANSSDGVIYEEIYGVMFPYPLKLHTGLSVNVTTADSVDIYYS